MNEIADKKELEVIEISTKKIILKTNYSWAFCLDANQEDKIKYYSLSTNFLNLQKLQNIFPTNILLKSWTADNNLSRNETLYQLRGYQKEDVKFLSNLKSVAIFSEMRTGKTPTALKTFEKWSVSNLLVIVPSILQQQWQRSIEDWLEKPSYVITSLEKKLRYKFYQKILQEKKWIIIVSKDTFKIDSVFFQKLKKRKNSKNDYCVIIDEAHFLRNYRSQQSKSIYVLNDAQYKMVLTGTPVVNHHTDIFGILKFLKPDVYTSYWKFARQYFYVHETTFKKGIRTYRIFRVKDFKNKQLQQSFQKELSQFSVNRRQREVLPWLPEIIYQKEYLLMEEEQQSVYSEWKEKWKSYQPLEVLAKLKTLTLHPEALGVKSKGSKVSYLTDFLKERAEQQSIIVFSTRTETFLEPLAKALKERDVETKLITGKTNPRDRWEYIKKFQDGEIKFLLCNIQSAGVGLNLSRAETIIFADRSYSPADNEQAEARFLSTNRSESARVRLVIDLICKGTIDEKILQLLKRKENITKVINDNPMYFFD